MEHNGKETYINIYFPSGEKPSTFCNAENVVVCHNGLQFDIEGIDRKSEKSRIVIRGIPFMIVVNEPNHEEITGEDC